MSHASTNAPDTPRSAAHPTAVAIPPKGDSPDVEGYAADLDGDRRDEMILVYRKPPNGKDVVRIVEP